MGITKNLLFVFIILFIYSCSNPEKDYEPLQQQQTTAEQKLQNTSDDAARVNICDDVIAELDKFIKEHPEGEWNLTAKTALQSWQSKRGEFQENINLKMDFEEIQKLQDAAEQVMQHSTDYAVRMKNCDDIITAMQNYVTKHSKGEWTTSVNTALMSWESRKTSLDAELNTLYNSLYAKMRDKAITTAKRVHNFSNIETVTLKDREKQTEGSNLQVKDIYAVRMRGKIFGSSIFKLDITVIGGINPETKAIYVNEDAKVDE